MTTGLLTILLLLASVSAQSPEPSLSPSGDTNFAPGPGAGEDDCTTYLVNLVDCLSYVQAGSSLKKPEKPCCGELTELVKSHPVCLCELLSNSTNSLGIEIDVPRALKLQTICSIDTPVSLCSVVGYPIPGVPTSSPMSPVAGHPIPGVPTSSPMPPGMSPEGVAPSSETEKGGNAAYGIQFSHPSFFLVCLAIALFLPMFFSS